MDRQLEAKYAGMSGGKSMNVTVIEGTEQDIDSWMELVQSVRRTFPGLETEAALKEHRNTVLEFMNQKRAICVKAGNKIIGVLLFSIKYNMICCLAVSNEYRKQGIVRKLSLLSAFQITDLAAGAPKLVPRRKSSAVFGLPCIGGQKPLAANGA